MYKDIDQIKINDQQINTKEYNIQIAHRSGKTEPKMIKSEQIS